MCTLRSRGHQLHNAFKAKTFKPLADNAAASLDEKNINIS